MSDHILSLSYGKDSLACIHVIKEVLGWPLDRIIHAEVWATDTIPADLPPMVQFKAKADRIIKERWGIDVEHKAATLVDGIRGGRVSYQDVFYKILTAGAYAGSIKGFPNTVGNWCQKLKLKAMPKVSDGMLYLGIAADEPERIARHIGKTNTKLPLVEAGWTEAMCRNWCNENDLLSPIYTDSARGGCWFCHNQGVDQLRLLRKNYPEYWALLLKWDNDSPTTFKPDGHTVHDYEERFKLEDQGFIQPTDKWYWGYIENRPLQMKISF